VPEEALNHDSTRDVNPDPGAWSVVFYGLVGGLVVVLAIFGLEVFYGSTAGAEDERKAAGPAAEKLQQELDEQRSPIESYHWIDEDNGVVALPIERAMELVVQEAGK
jgi:hypothetical protein